MLARQTLYRDTAGSHCVGVLAAVDTAHTRDERDGWARADVLAARPARTYTNRGS